MLEIKRKVYDDKDWYEEYIQVLKHGKEIHYGESFELPKYENGNYIFYLKFVQFDAIILYCIFRSLCGFDHLILSLPTVILFVQFREKKLK